MAHHIKFIEPNAAEPISATFLVWVMLVVGGSANNRGAIFGAILIWTIWSAAEILIARLPPEWAVKSAYLRIFLVGLALQFILQRYPDGIFRERRFRTAPSSSTKGATAMKRMMIARGRGCARPERRLCQRRRYQCGLRGGRYRSHRGAGGRHRRRPQPRREPRERAGRPARRRHLPAGAGRFAVRPEGRSRRGCQARQRRAGRGGHRPQLLGRHQRHGPVRHHPGRRGDDFRHRDPRPRSRTSTTTTSCSGSRPPTPTRDAPSPSSPGSTATASSRSPTPTTTTTQGSPACSLPPSQSSAARSPATRRTSRARHRTAPS